MRIWDVAKQTLQDSGCDVGWDSHSVSVAGKGHCHNTGVQTHHWPNTGVQTHHSLLATGILWCCALWANICLTTEHSCAYGEPAEDPKSLNANRVNVFLMSPWLGSRFSMGTAWWHHAGTETWERLLVSHWALAALPSQLSVKKLWLLQRIISKPIHATKIKE